MLDGSLMLLWLLVVGSVSSLIHALMVHMVGLPSPWLVLMVGTWVHGAIEHEMAWLTTVMT